ncbi:hypothetical protein ACEV6Q_26865 [Enterobacter ludwigii]|uniref:hypothetical protein n=1 Tax=Enterobacter ludwigii TaxID=299767 RepID=UPI003BEF0EC1
MKRKPDVKPVLLSAEQMAALRAIQRQEAERSPLGIEPGIHEVARRLMAKALADVAGLHDVVQPVQ